jgi:hypothetical protein
MHPSSLLPLLPLCLYAVVSLLYIQLPVEVACPADYPKVTVVEFLARLIYFYPVTFLGYFGADWQLRWVRWTVANLVLIFNPWTGYDPDLWV